MLLTQESMVNQISVKSQIFTLGCFEIYHVEKGFITYQ